MIGIIVKKNITRCVRTPRDTKSEGRGRGEEERRRKSTLLKITR